MRKLFAILMIATHLFNLAGYKFLFGYYTSQSDKKIVQQLDNNLVPDSELVEIKVKLNLPYITAFGEYERMDGEYELNGEYYKYVKRRILNDTLFLLCLPDHKKNELAKGKAEYAARTNELPAKDGQPSSLKKGIFTSDYCFQTKTTTTQLFPEVVNVFIPAITTELTKTFIDSDCQPPDTLS